MPGRTGEMVTSRGPEALVFFHEENGPSPKQGGVL